MNSYIYIFFAYIQRHTIECAIELNTVFDSSHLYWRFKLKIVVIVKKTVERSFYLTIFNINNNKNNKGRNLLQPTIYLRFT